MAAISASYGKGGAGIGDGSTVAPPIAAVLRDVADDLAALHPASVVTADSAATTVSDSEATALVDADALYTQNEEDLINDLKAKYNSAVTLINDLKAKHNSAVTLINELKTVVNALAAHVVKTTKG